MMRAHWVTIRRRVLVPLCGLGLAASLIGCESTQSTGVDRIRPSQVRSLDMSGVTDPTDQDRIALGRFVGAWDFEGWYDPPEEERRETAGIAAGVIEHKYFLQIDSARITEQGDMDELSVGSMLLSAEPGIGLMMTSWSSDSPVVSRFGGTVEAEGSRFTFKEFRTLNRNDRLRLILRFETDDRWVAEFYRKGNADVLAASYTFTRSD